MRPPLSLKGRALALLAQREQSVVELRRKLLRHAQAAARAGLKSRSAGVALDVDGDPAPASEPESDQNQNQSEDQNKGQNRDQVHVQEVQDQSQAQAATAQVDAVIAWLREHDYLSEDRFVEGRMHARSARFGQPRIRHELAQHGLALSPEQAAALQSTEFERAAEVWRRKFGQAPADRAAQAKQARFLMARGFSSDIVRRLVVLDRGAAACEPDD